jgi:MerR HTH family regulatory protein
MFSPCSALSAFSADDLLPIMSTSDEQPVEAGQEFQFEPEQAYSLEVIEKITLVPRRTILVYHRHGLIQSSTGPDRSQRVFDDEAVRALRRIESLRQRCKSGRYQTDYGFDAGSG